MTSRAGTPARLRRLASSCALALALPAWGAGGAEAAAKAPAPPFDEIGIDQRLGAPLPFDLVFRDEEGADVRLADLSAGRPLVITFAYFRCPMLCSLVRNGLASSLGVVGLAGGKDFTAVTISIDPEDAPEMAAAARRELFARYEGLEARSGWRFLTGREEAIREVTRAAGFRYVRDETTGQFAHASGVIVVTPQGIISQYLLGIDYAPKDLRLAVVEASGGKVGTMVDRLTLLCYQYDPATGHYGFVAYTIVRTGGVITVLALAVFVVIMFRREARAARGRSAQGV